MCVSIFLVMLHTMVVRVRRPIGFRPPSNQIASAVQSDSVRRPIGFRSPSDRQHTLTKVVKIMTNAPFPHLIPLKT